jgi:hypothetical protein
MEIAYLPSGINIFLKIKNYKQKTQVIPDKFNVDGSNKYLMKIK